MKRSNIKTKDWTKLVDKSADKEVLRLYTEWKQYDHTIVGLVRILMIQEIKWSIKQKGEFYYDQYDSLLECVKKNYTK